MKTWILWLKEKHPSQLSLHASPLNLSSFWGGYAILMYLSDSSNVEPILLTFYMWDVAFSGHIEI